VVDNDETSHVGADSDRVEVSVVELPPRGTYPWLTACIIPRPIAWVSTLSAAGVPNLAPHSFFTVASHEPPVLSFTSVGTKDSLRNVRETGEFVVCLASGDLRTHVNDSSARYSPEQDEFHETGLATEPSRVVQPHRVASSPVALECVLVGERSFAEGDRASTVVFGRVVHLAVSRAAMADDGLPDPVLLDPVARLGREQWSHLGAVFELKRPGAPPPRV